MLDTMFKYVSIVFYSGLIVIGNPKNTFCSMSGNGVQLLQIPCTCSQCFVLVLQKSKKKKRKKTNYWRPKNIT